MTLTHSLMLGDLTLTGDASFPDPEHGFWFEVCAEGTEFGSPEAVTRIVTSLLTDGAIVSYDSDANRTIPVRVRVNGPTLAAVAQGEAALRRASNRRNELTWQPPDTFAPVSVYETYPSSMRSVQEAGWDLDELVRRVRTFSLSLTCAPHAMSADATTVAALPAPSGSATTVTVDECDSAAGWSASVDSTPATVDMAWSPGAVSVHELLDSAPQSLRLTRTGSVDFSATRYLVVEVGYNASFGAIPVDASGAAGTLTRLSQRQIESGWYECIYDTGAAVLGSLSFSAYFPQEFADLKIRKVSRTDAPPSRTARQVSRIINVGGTERTPTSIKVAAANGTDDLGLTMVHTSPEDGSGYSPPLRRWRTSGNAVTADTATVSGGRELLHPNPVAFAVPTSSLPEGGYLLCAFLRVGVVGDHSIYFSSYTQLPPPNDSTLMGEVVNRVTVNFPVANTWQLVPLGIITLPTVRTSAGKIIVGIQRDAASLDDIILDEAWLFRVDDDCALSIANVPASNLWLDSPDVDSPVPTIWMGDSMESRTHPGGGLVAQGNHVLHPDGTAVFVATLGTQWPEVSGTFHRRWHSNAAE